MNQVQLHVDALGLFVIIGLMSALCTWVVVNNAGRFGLLDVPNERSSHASTTPRGGGLSIVLATFLGLLLFKSLKNPTPNQIAPVMLSGAIVALIGLFDDLGKVRSISSRLAAHVVAACIGLWIIGGVPQFSVSSYAIEPTIIGNVFAILYVVWLINLYNFMDGINGLAGVEAISVCVLVSVLSARNGLTATPVISLMILAGAVAGFLVFNFPFARVFMGDVGSGFLGLTFAMLSLISANEKENMFWVWLIMLGVFIVDASYTLCHRLIHGENVKTAHRNHAYQVLARRLNSHRSVTIGVLIVNVFWLFPVAFLVVEKRLSGVVAVAIAYSPIVVAVHYFSKGKGSLARSNEV
jgi:Fuc2NAc and GlcNAc transferase